MSEARHSDEEIVRLHDEVKELSVRLDEVLDALLTKVMERLQQLGEGTAEREHAITEALAELQSFRDVDRRASGRGALDHSPTESSQRSDGASAESGSN